MFLASAIFHNDNLKPLQAMLTNQQQQDPQSEELNFTAFTDLCRFCSLRLGAKINLFDKEAEHRQLLFKVRTFLPTAVYSTFITS